jgi:hypothetical protein
MSSLFNAYFAVKIIATFTQQHTLELLRRVVSTLRDIVFTQVFIEER